MKLSLRPGTELASKLHRRRWEGDARTNKDPPHARHRLAYCVRAQPRLDGGFFRIALNPSGCPAHVGRKPAFKPLGQGLHGVARSPGIAMVSPLVEPIRCTGELEVCTRFITASSRSAGPVTDSAPGPRRTRRHARGVLGRRVQHGSDTGRHAISASATSSPPSDTWWAAVTSPSPISARTTSPFSRSSTNRPGAARPARGRRCREDKATARASPASRRSEGSSHRTP